MSRPPFSLSGCTLAVLAGGEGSRMGMPKGLLRIGGQPILEYVLDRFAWPGPTLLVTAPGREHPPGWERFGREAADPVAGMGPLRGVLTALENTTTEWAAVVTVDMPGIRREQIERLGDSLNEAVLGAMFRRDREAGGKLIEPFPLLLRAAASQVIRLRIDRGELSVARLLDEPAFQVTDAPATWDNDVWINLNSPADLK